MSALAWATKRFGVLGTLLIAALLALVLWLAVQNAWHRVTGWWDGRKLERVTAERDVARKDAATAESSADVADRAASEFDERLGAHHAAAAATQGDIDARILAAPARSAADPDDPAILRAVDAARARAEAAAHSVRGTARAEPDPRASR